MMTNKQSDLTEDDVNESADRFCEASTKTAALEAVHRLGDKGLVY